MGAEIRTITPDEIPAWVEAMQVGFHAHAHDGEAELRRSRLEEHPDRVFAAVDGGAIVATLRSFPTNVVVPGGASVSAAALTNVTVTPTHRRQGLMSRMLTADLEASSRRGEVTGILVAAEWPIYGRFGYGPAVEAATYTVDASVASFLRPRPAGSFGLVSPTELRAVAPAVWERQRRRFPGEIDRAEQWWDLLPGVTDFPGEDPWKGYQAVYRSDDGMVDGYVQYKLEGDFDGRRPRKVLVVEDLVAATPVAYDALWRYCCEVDWVVTVRAENRSVAEPLPYLLRDGRVVQLGLRHDFVWLRLLDVAAGLAARRYLREGRLVLEVVDPTGLSGGRFALEGGPEGATCTPADGTADLTLPMLALGAAYLGGAPVQVLADAGLVDEHTPGAVERADALFRSPVTPWCTTWF